MRSQVAKIVVPILLLIFCFGIYYSITSDYNFIQDDSYISFRYAENFVNGEGLVFNEGENVEGYTSFLWVIVLSLLKILHLDLEVWSQILSFLFGIGVITLTFLISQKLIPTTNNHILITIIQVLPSYLLAFTGGFAYWAISGMETSLFIILLLSGLFFLLKKDTSKVNYVSVIFFVLAALTRPEGYYFIFFYFLYRFISIRKEKDSFGKVFCTELLLAITPLIMFFIFRLVYYGYPLPNTFYAKAGISQFFLRRGFEYFLEFAKANLLFGFVLIIPVMMFIKFKKDRILLGLFAISIFYIIIIILIGGDVLPFHRLFLPALPIIYILFINAIIYFASFLSKKILKNILYIIIVLLVVFTGYINFRIEQPRLNDIHATELGLVYKMKIYAEWVKEKQQETHQQQTVALSTIGAFSYFSDSKIIDLLGLTNEYIAHNPAEMKGISEPATRNWVERTYNAGYVLQQEPDYIIFPAGAKPSAFPESALFVSPLFKELYYPQLIQTDKLNEIITVYTLRTKNSESYEPNIDTTCKESASVKFIDATNLFLRYSKNRDLSLIPRIIEKADSALNLCPLIKDDVYELKGMLYYFMDRMNNSKDAFSKAIKIDSMNSFSYLYLINISRKEGDQKKAYQYLSKLKKLSPDLYPQFTFQK